MDIENLDQDEALAMQLQADFFAELESGSYEVHDEMSGIVPTHEAISNSPVKGGKNKAKNSVVAPEWEDLDPTPDLHALFLQFNDRFFWSKLSGCEVKWSPRMTLCAGVCSYQRRSGYCSIRLSVPLLKLRPRKDLVETLLHEMIHAYLFVTNGDDDHDGHGPAFHSHMYRINKEQGTNISVYHNFHDEVDNYRQHWWKCDGPCQHRKPFYGLVKRSMNRAPGPNDRWWADHQNSCGGTYTKIKEPDGYGQKKKGAKKAKIEKENQPLQKGQKDIRSMFGSSASTSSENPSKPGTSSGKSHGGGGAKGNIFGFGGTSFAGVSGVQTKGKTGAFVVKAGNKTKDNSSSGSVVSAASGSNIKSSTKTSLDAAASKVRDTVRNVWANKFSGPGSSNSSLSKTALNSSVTEIVDNDEDTEETDKVPCPVCSSAIEKSEINQHLDACLSQSTRGNSVLKANKHNPFLDDDDEVEIEEQPPRSNDKKAEKPTCITLEEDTVDCPICSRKVYSGQINNHLDNCVKEN